MTTKTRIYNEPVLPNYGIKILKESRRELLCRTEPI